MINYKKWIKKILILLAAALVISLILTTIERSLIKSKAGQPEKSIIKERP